VTGGPVVLLPGFPRGRPDARRPGEGWLRRPRLRPARSCGFGPRTSTARTGRSSASKRQVSALYQRDGPGASRSSSGHSRGRVTSRAAIGAARARGAFRHAISLGRRPSRPSSGSAGPSLAAGRGGPGRGPRADRGRTRARRRCMDPGVHVRLLARRTTAGRFPSTRVRLNEHLLEGRRRRALAGPPSCPRPNASR